MDWKEFFKPDIYKVMLFILFGPAFVFIQSFYQITPTDPIFTTILNIATIPFFSVYLNLFPPSQSFISSIFPFNILSLGFSILDAFYRYFIACVVVWIYHQTRKKRKTQFTDHY